MGKCKIVSNFVFPFNYLFFYPVMKIFHILGILFYMFCCFMHLCLPICVIVECMISNSITRNWVRICESNEWNIVVKHLSEGFSLF